MKLAPQGHYNLNGGSLVGSTLHDLNTIDSRNPEIDGITDTDRDAPTGDELDNDEDSTSGGVCHRKLKFMSSHKSAFYSMCSW